MNNPFVRTLHTFSRILSAYCEQNWALDGYKEIRIGHLQPLLELSLGDFSNNQLADKSGMTKQSMNRLVKELVELGYVKMDKDQKDARVILLKLSPKGQAFVQYLELKNQELDDFLISGIGMGPYQILKENFQSLLTYMENQELKI
jgi:DNA-binding MarR family transcriptional regulator